MCRHELSNEESMVGPRAKSLHALVSDSVTTESLCPYFLQNPEVDLNLVFSIFRGLGERWSLL